MSALLFAVAGVVSAVAYVLTRKSAPGLVSPPVSSPTPATAPEELPDIIVIQGAEMTASTSGLRGIRNNNPGNIDWIKDPAKRWRGMVRLEPPAPGITPRFGVFDTPANGIRAIARELLLDETRGVRTVTGLINNWAPSNENQTSVYAKYVADRLNVLPDEIIDIGDRLPELVNAIILFENGKNPYSPTDVAEWVRT